MPFLQKIFQKKGMLWPWALSVADGMERAYQSSGICHTLRGFSRVKEERADESGAASRAFTWSAAAFLLFFPFLFLSGHSTRLCLGAVLFLDGWWLWEIRGTKYVCSFCERCALLLAFFFFLGGLSGAGEALDGIAAAVGVTVLFPMRHASRLGRDRLQLAILIGSGPVSLYGIWQYFFGDLPLLWTDTAHFSDIGSRVTSVFDNPNILGIYLLLTLPVSLVGILQSRGGMRICSLICLPLGLLCLVFTWSRGAWLGAILEILLVLLCTSRHSRAALVLSPVAFAAALPFLPGSIYHRFSGIATLGESSVRYRIYSWKGILRMLWEHPFGIGVGEAAFVRVYPSYAVSGTERVMHAHNVFLQVCAELGIPGLLAFLLLLAGLLLPALVGARERSATAAICGACVMGMFDHLWYARGMLVLFFSVVGLALGGVE